MLSAIGAASAAVDLLKSLTSKTSSSQTANFNAATTASDTASTTPVNVAGTASQSGSVSPQTMSALLDAQSQSGVTPTSTSNKSQSKALKDLFDLIDGNGDGSVTKSEFSDALGAGGTNTAHADSVFDRLDSDGSGTVSVDELASALKGKSKKRQAETTEQADPLLKALDEANQAQEASRSAASSYAMTDQAVQRAAQVTAAAKASTLSVSA